jgi:prevent-host-death family protein
MPETVNIYEAKTHLSQLIARVESGEEMILTRHGRPVARLVPFTAQSKPREPGVWRGKVNVADDFDEFSVDDDREWYGA